METNERQLTVKDVLEDVKKVLGGIEVPATKIESIGIPIARAMNGIQMCIDAMNKDEQKQEEPEFEITAEPGGENDA